MIDTTRIWHIENSTVVADTVEEAIKIYKEYWQDERETDIKRIQLVTYVDDVALIRKEEQQMKKFDYSNATITCYDFAETPKMEEAEK